MVKMRTAVWAAIVVAMFLAVLALAGCGGTAPPPDEPAATLVPEPLPTVAPTPAVPTAEPTPTMSPLDAANVLAREAVLALRDQEMATVAALVDPELGLVFSPDAYVDDTDQRFSPDEVAGLLADPTTYLWGYEAGSGFPIETTFAEYYTEYVYDQDYANAPQVGFGERIGGAGGTIDNTDVVWPGSVAVEYHFPGTEEYGGLDWTSLRLVLAWVDDEWALAGVIHDAWSP